MVNTYHSINPTTNTMLAIKNALEVKYGAGVTIHFQDATNLIFTCAALSNKVQRLLYNAGSRIIFYYGDAWTSGTTITNQVKWAGYDAGACIFIDMVLGANLMMLCSNQGTSVLSTLFLIGKLTNDKFSFFSACGGNSAGYYSVYLSKNTTDNIDLFPVCFSDAFASGLGKLFKQPLILQRSDGTVELNTDGTIASFKDVYNCSHALANNVDLVGPNYLMSSAGLYTGVAGKRLWTSMIAEF